MNNSPVRIGVVGCGLMATDNMKLWLNKAMDAGYVFAVIADPSEKARENILALFRDMGMEAPAVVADAAPETCARMAKEYNLDMAYIASPTAFHAPQAIAFMQAGVDVLLEKPAAPTVSEIRTLVSVEQKTGRKLSIGFNGSFCHGMRLLSAIVAGDKESFAAHLDMLRHEDPQQAEKIARLQPDDFATPRRVSGMIWENWLDRYRTSWKFEEGFIRDCAIHMLNAFYDVTRQTATSVRARLTQDQSDTGHVTGDMTKGARYRLRFLGDMKENICESRLRIRFYSGACCEFDIWGKWFKISDAHGHDVAWERAGDDKVDPLFMFLAYREGRIGNPNPVSRSLGLAELMDEIEISAHGRVLQGQKKLAKSA